MCQRSFITPKKECISCEHRNGGSGHYGTKYPWTCYNPARVNTRTIKVVHLGLGSEDRKFPEIKGLKPCLLLNSKSVVGGLKCI